MEHLLTELIIVILLLAFFWGIGELLARVPGLPPPQAPPGKGRRFESLDGLRGFLALAVFLHHAWATHQFVITNKWEVTRAPFEMMGGVPVTLFFMMTGFLFWTKALKAKGRVRPLELYRGRVLRIVPMYLFCAVLMFIIIIALSGVPILQTFRGSFTGVLRLFGSGGLLAPTPINNIDPGDINASVLWTLRSEWKFYLALPLLAFFARPLGLLIFAFICGALHVRYHTHMGSTAIFIFGMAAAQWVQSFGSRDWARGRLAAIGAAALIAASLLLFTDAYVLPVYCMLFVVFLALLNGCTFRGLLVTKGARFLGDISYSIYLLHGILLFLCRPFLAPLIRPGTPGPLYWIAIGTVGAGVIGISALTHRCVEYPFMRLEQRLKKTRPAATKSLTESSTPKAAEVVA